MTVTEVISRVKGALDDKTVIRLRSNGHENENRHGAGVFLSRAAECR
jgi:hypothetical protein